MSFQNHGARAFTITSVHKNAPAASGVYGLSSAREWIYIGEAEDVQGRLLEHLRERHTFQKTGIPTGFTFELCASESRVARQESLVRELRPACNQAGPASLASGHKE